MGEHKGNQYTKMEIAQNEPFPNTANKFAEQYKVSPATVKRAEKYADAVDSIEQTIPGLKQEILSGELDITKNDVISLSKLETKKQKRVINIQKVVEDKMSPTKKHL